jgi:hypothetical protein
MEMHGHCGCTFLTLQLDLLFLPLQELHLLVHAWCT